MQKSQGAKSTARRRPLRVLSSNRATRAPESLRRKRAPPAASPSAATADAALDRLLLARSDLSGLVSQIDELVSNALQSQTMSNRGKQEIESFSCFVSDTNTSLKQWSARLKQAFEAPPAKSENASKHTKGTCSISTAKGNDKLLSSSSILPNASPTLSLSCNLVSCNTNLAEPETNQIVSPSPLVSWRTGACMVESGKQLFLLTPLTKAKACSSRCPGSSKMQLNTPANMDQLNIPNLPVWKVTISDNDCPDLEKSVKVKEARTGVFTPHFIKAKKGSSEDKLFSPVSFSIQKSKSSPCLNTALSSRQQQFSPISEGSRKEVILSAGQTESDKPSGASDDMLSDEVSKDLASRYPDLYGFKQSTRNTYRMREADETLDWFLSPLKTCVLMDPSDDKPVPTPERDSKSLIGTPWKGMESNILKGRLELSHDNKPIQTPAVHSKALLSTTWKGLESTNLKGRRAGETTLKKELWTRFEAVSTNALHFDKSVFQRSDGRRFIDMLEEAS